MVGNDVFLPDGFGIFVYDRIIRALHASGRPHQARRHHIAVVGKRGKNARHLQGGDDELTLSVACRGEKLHVFVIAAVEVSRLGDAQIKRDAFVKADHLEEGFELLPARFQRHICKIDVVGFGDGIGHIDRTGIIGDAGDGRIRPIALGRPLLFDDLTGEFVVFVHHTVIQSHCGDQRLDGGAGDIGALHRAVV